MPRHAPSPSSQGTVREPRRRVVHRRGVGRTLALALAAAALAACGDGQSLGAPPQAEIFSGPRDAAVFPGQQAHFQVVATGPALTYQWSRDGVEIPGATSARLVTPALTEADDGATFQVVVSAGGRSGPVSRAARVTLHPPVDLRFKWVGSPFAPDYHLTSNLGGGPWTFRPGVGSPLLMGGEACAAAPVSCDWLITVDTFSAPPGFDTAYEPEYGLFWLDAALAGLASDTVLTSLDVQESFGAFATSTVRTTQRGGFRAKNGSAAPADLADVAATLGASGEVITAVSFQEGLVRWVAHGWTEAPAARFETAVATATVAGAPAAAAGLAAQGYVITALGAGNGGRDGVVMVGTRKEGETTPRPFLALDLLDSPKPDGYVVVGLLYDPEASTFSLLLQR